MSNISANLAAILAARYGRDVRQAIHDGILDCYADAIVGIQGPQGIPGPKGDKGDKGNTGASINAAIFDGNNIKFTKDDATTVSLPNAKLTLKGDQGIQGIQGPQGIKGDTGGKGDTGNTGATGATITGAHFNGNDMRFTKSDATNVDITGAKTTLKGDQGIQGPQGGKGDTGLTGPQGANVVSAAFVGNDIRFTKSDAAYVDLSNAKVTLKGEQGIKGDKGDKGDTGNTGLTGPTISAAAFVGDAMRFTKTDSTYVDLASAKTLLKGDQGIIGPPGNVGPAGPTINSAGWNGNDMRFTKSDASVVDLTGAKIALKGDAGAKGAADFVWIKYWNVNPTTNAMMKDTIDAWMGVYSGPSATAPTTIASYKWFKIKGQDGVIGVDGVKAFVWIRWAAVNPTADNQLSTTPNEWMGIYTGTLDTAPTTRGSYTWYKVKGEDGAAGAAGAAGADGATITAVAWDGNDMKFTDSKSATFKLTNAKVDLKGVAGADGIDGADGADFDPAVYISVSDVSNTFTCNVNSKRNVNFALTIANATAKTITFTNVPTGRCEVFLEILSEATASVTWTLKSGSVTRWVLAGLPDISVGVTNRIMFVTTDGGAKWSAYHSPGVMM